MEIKMNLDHLLPKKNYVKVYYHNGYDILVKEFSNTDYAQKFITDLKTLSQVSGFKFLKVRRIKEFDLKEWD